MNTNENITATVQEENNTNETPQAMTDGPIVVHEEDHPEKEWFAEAKKQTIDTLVDFIKHLMTDYQHDYGTIAHAISACALAATHAADEMPQGGITGFQAGFVMWDFIFQYMYPANKCGLKLVNHDDMLYPQYSKRYEKTIRRNVWNDLQNEAIHLLETNPNVHPSVREHWQNIVDGIIPFGYTINDDN